MGHTVLVYSNCLDTSRYAHYTLSSIILYLAVTWGTPVPWPLMLSVFVSTSYHTALVNYGSQASLETSSVGVCPCKHLLNFVIARSGILHVLQLSLLPRIPPPFPGLQCFQGRIGGQLPVSKKEGKKE